MGDAENRNFQTAILTFSNGKVGSFTGKAVLDPDEDGVHVVHVQMTRPRPLPADCFFGELETAEENGRGDDEEN